MGWIFIAGAAIVAIALAAYLASNRREKNEYSGTVETREIQVGSKIGGRVLAVPVEEGQTVKAGTLLVRFECDELKAQRAQAAAQADAARAELMRLLHGNRREEIAQAEAAAKAEQSAVEEARNGPRTQEVQQASADYAAAKADAGNAADVFRRMATLAAKDEISQQEFDDARAKRDAAAEHAEAARQRLELLRAGTRPEDLQTAEERFQQAQAAAALARKGARPEDIAAARARLAEAEGHVNELDVRLKEAELRAPADAVVEVLSVRPGDLAPAGRIIVTMLEPSQLWVKVYVQETELGRVHIGETASVQVDAFPGRSFSGRVGQIDSEAEFLPRNVQTRNDREHEVFGAKVYVDNASGILKSGMSATVRLQ